MRPIDAIGIDAIGIEAMGIDAIGIEAIGAEAVEPGVVGSADRSMFAVGISRAPGSDVFGLTVTETFDATAGDTITASAVTELFARPDRGDRRSRSRWRAGRPGTPERS